MKRNFVFKPGRGSKMLEELQNKENRLQNSMDYNFLPPIIEDCSEDCLEGIKPIQNRTVSTDGDNFNSSADIIEDTPPDTPYNLTRLQNAEMVSPVSVNQLYALEEDQLIQNPMTSTDGDQYNILTEIIEINENTTEAHPNLKTTITSELTMSSSTHDNIEIMRLEDDLYISDDSVADPDWRNEDNIATREVDSDSDEPETIMPKKIKVTRWHKTREDSYDRNIQKLRRSQCLPYKNYKKKTQPPKAPKPGNCECKLNCLQNFTEEERIEICKNYWGLNDYCRQKDFILMNISVKPPQRCLVNSTKKRTVSRTYYFQVADRKIKVCEKFFKSTLCISNGPINKAFSKTGNSGNFEGEDKRGKHVAHNKTKQEDIDFIKENIEAFPTMESHYCRKSSSKLYLSSNLTITKMYELYVEKCKTASKPPMSVNVYRNVFCTQYNLDFHKPKKDQCLLCHKYNCAKEQNSPDLPTWEEKYKLHMSLKEQSREAKNLDKIRANEDETFNSITIDLQKVLHMPNSNVSLLYYLRKLNVYNATIYEGRSPNDGFCYIWSETDGKKGSDEVGTALYLWIKRLPSTVKEISIFSDTCGGQNRNQFLLCLQMYLVQTTHLEVIEHKYLESGHTHMEVDSMHSAIENQMRLMPVFSMIDLCNIIRLARSNRNKKKNAATKKPYEPIVMNNGDILNLKDLRDSLMQNRSLGSDGEKVQWLKVKCFRFEKLKPNIVLYRYDYESDYKELNVSKKEKNEPATLIKNLRKRQHTAQNIKEFDYGTYNLKKAYNKKLPITKAKKKDLLKMCKENIIPPELHHWYQNLPDKEGPDFLPDEDYSDEEQ